MLIEDAFLQGENVLKYTGPYIIPEEIRPITTDILYLLNSTLASSGKTPYVVVTLSLTTFDEWSKFEGSFEFEQDSLPTKTAYQKFINNIITTLLIELAKLDRSAVLTFERYSSFKTTVRNYKILFESSSEDDPFKE